MEENKIQTASDIQFTDPRLAKLYDELYPLGIDARFFIKLVQELSPTTVIDVGCGSGILTCELAKLGYKTIGVEPAKELLLLQCV